jgi:hypothetical protein
MTITTTTITSITPSTFQPIIPQVITILRLVQESTTPPTQDHDLDLDLARRLKEDQLVKEVSAPLNLLSL